MEKKPNIIVIMTDEQRADTLALYGNPLVQTPNIDRLAAQGTVFDNAFVTYPQCVPSRASFMTGRYAHVHGSTANTRAGGYNLEQMSASGGLGGGEIGATMELQEREVHHLPVVLKAAGYKIGLAGKDHCFGPKQRADFDFIADVSHFGPGLSNPDLTRRYVSFLREARLFVGGVGGWAEAPFGAEECPAGLAATGAIEFLNRFGDQPFFLWFSIPEPHLPLTCPPPWSRMYDPKDVAVPAYHEGELRNKPERQQVLSRIQGLHQAPDETKIREMTAMYWGMVSYADAQIGRVLAELDRRGLTDNTIVVFISDHGDYMSEHQLLWKSISFYDCLMKTPLIVSWPAGLKGGTRAEALVSEVDVMPTILDLVGVETPAVVQGYSFAPLLRGEPYTEQTAVFGEGGVLEKPLGWDDVEGVPLPDEAFGHRRRAQGNRPMRVGAPWTGRAKMIRTKEWKYNHYLDGGERELYHLVNDPREIHNLAGDPRFGEVEERLRAQLLDWCIRTEDTYYGK